MSEADGVFTLDCPDSSVSWVAETTTTTTTTTTMLPSQDFELALLDVTVTNHPDGCPPAFDGDDFGPCTEVLAIFQATGAEPHLGTVCAAYSWGTPGGPPNQTLFAAYWPWGTDGFGYGANAFPTRVRYAADVSPDRIDIEIVAEVNPDQTAYDNACAISPDERVPESDYTNNFRAATVIDGEPT